MENPIKTAVLGLLLLSGCNTLTVRTDYDTHYDFSGLETYAWLEGKAPSNDIRINNSLIINRVVNAVNSNLEFKGYTQVDKDKADFYVNWFGGIQNKIRQQTIDSYYNHSNYDTGSWGHGDHWPGYVRTYSFEYQEGTLIIDVADSKSKQLIWRGTGQKYLEEKETPEKITESINQIVTGILSSFPPAKRPL